MGTSRSGVVPEPYPNRDGHRSGDQLGPVPADGLVSEVAGWDDTGLHVIAVWDSKSQHDRFIAERLVPRWLRRRGT